MHEGGCWRWLWVPCKYRPEGLAALLLLEIQVCVVHGAVWCSSGGPRCECSGEGWRCYIIDGHPLQVAAVFLLDVLANMSG